MELLSGKYIQHRIIIRPSGPECQFTVDKDAVHVNAVISIPSEKIEEKDLAELIDSYVKSIPVVDDTPIKSELELAVEAKEQEIKDLLVSKGLIKETDSIADVKSAAEYKAG